MSEMEWIVQVSDAVDQAASASAERVYWKKRCIYKIPACVTDLNKKAYRPEAVSFGPYHHDEAHLRPMEEHKWRALLHFLKRSGRDINDYFESLKEVVQDLQDCYDPLDAKWRDDTVAFLKLMILDGCFMLEILRTGNDTMNDYAPNDPIFSGHGKLHILPYIRRDMLMIENQLPMLALDRLVAVESYGKQGKEYVAKLIINFCALGASVAELGDNHLHVLDVYRKSMLLEGPRKTSTHRMKKNKTRDDILRSATELYEAGIWFKKSKSSSLRDISFNNGILRLPVIVVDDTTESMFLNLIAFERFHFGAGKEVTSYIFFMDNIIDSERDVALLHSKGIIQNAIGSDKAVAKLFNSLSKDVTLDPDSSLDIVHKNVSSYCRKPCNMWRANLIHTYFRNPWSVLSLIAAIFLFALTIVQTIYTIRQANGSKS